MEAQMTIDPATYSRAEAEAARRGETLSQVLEQVVRQHFASAEEVSRATPTPADEFNREMDALLKRTSHFRIGQMPTREEMNER